jgi:hypothetical protein
MKAIDSKNLIKAMKDGKTEKKQISMTKKSPLNIDDREPIERVADEMTNIAESIHTMNQSRSNEITKIVEVIQTMSRSQADEVTKLLKLVLVAIEKVGMEKQKTPVTQSPEKEDVKPKKWKLTIAERDTNGMIKSINLVVDDL